MALSFCFKATRSDQSKKEGPNGKPVAWLAGDTAMPPLRWDKDNIVLFSRIGFHLYIYR